MSANNCRTYPNIRRKQMSNIANRNKKKGLDLSPFPKPKFRYAFKRNYKRQSTSGRQSSTLSKESRFISSDCSKVDSVRNLADTNEVNAQGENSGTNNYDNQLSDTESWHSSSGTEDDDYSDIEILRKDNSTSTFVESQLNSIIQKPGYSGMNEVLKAPCKSKLKLQKKFYKKLVPKSSTKLFACESSEDEEEEESLKISTISDISHKNIFQEESGSVSLVSKRKPTLTSTPLEGKEKDLPQEELDLSNISHEDALFLSLADNEKTPSLSLTEKNLARSPVCWLVDLPSLPPKPCLRIPRSQAHLFNMPLEGKKDLPQEELDLSLAEKESSLLACGRAIVTPKTKLLKDTTQSSSFVVM